MLLLFSTALELVSVVREPEDPDVLSKACT